MTHRCSAVAHGRVQGFAGTAVFVLGLFAGCGSVDRAPEGATGATGGGGGTGGA